MNGFWAGVDTTGLEELIISLFKWIIEFDIKTIKIDEYVPQLLTMFAPIWNPIWAYVNQLLNEYFGF